MVSFTRALALTSLSFAGLAAAQPATVSPRPHDTTPRDWTDDVKAALLVYDNKDSFVQKLRFSLREQFQVAVVQPNGSNGLHLRDGASPVNQEFRRTWLGVDADFACGTHFHAWLRPGGLPARETFADGRTRRHFSYTNFYDIYIRQDIHAVEGLSVSVGKLKPMFTTEFSTSSSSLLCLERSVVASQFGFDSNWGVDVTYEPNKQNKFYFQLFANDRAPAGKSLRHADVYRDGRGLKGEFGWEDKCYTIIGASRCFGLSEEGYHRISAQYAHDFNNAYHGRREAGANYYGPAVQDAFSLGYDFRRGPLTFMSNLVLSLETMDHGSHNVGLVLQPSWRLNPHVELVFRYTGMVGDDACRLAADRYICTQTDAPAWADSLHAFYFGADFYASAHNPHAAKLMLGAEYTTARAQGPHDFNGWVFSSAVRFNF